MTGKCGDHGGTNRHDEPCGKPEGWGTDFSDGKCRHHRGTSPDGSSHEANGNAETHALTADPKKYHQRQPDEEREWIFEMSEVICDRIRRNRGRVDPLDRTLARRVAIKLHIAANATEYIDQEGLMQTIMVEKNGATFEKEIPNALVNELRQYDREIVSELQKLGVLDDPESQKAGATDNLAEAIAEVTRDGGE